MHDGPESGTDLFFPAASAVFRTRHPIFTEKTLILFILLYLDRPVKRFSWPGEIIVPENAHFRLFS